MSVATLILSFALATASQPDCRGERSLQEAFASARSALIVEGVHRTHDFVFSSIHFPVTPEESGRSEDIHREHAALLATRGFLKAKVSEVLPLGDRSLAVRNVAQLVALSCAENPIVLHSIRTCFDETVGDELIVVQGMPIAVFDAVKVTVTDIVPCLIARAAVGPFSVPEAMALLELVPPGDPQAVPAREIALRTLSAVYGDGIETTVRRTWVKSDGTLDKSATDLWCVSLQRSLSSGKGLPDALAPIDRKQADTLGLEERFALLGHRLHDPAAIDALVQKLTADGWTRAVELFSVAPLAIARLRDHPGSKLPPELRAKIASNPIVTLLLLSDGQAGIQLSNTKESEAFLDARRLFQVGTAEALLQAVELVRSDLDAAPTHEGLVLLGATLLALNDPALARPVCVAAFNAVPVHRYAGINMLRALRALELTESARELIPRVRSETNNRLDSWGQSQLATIESWSNPVAPLPPK